LLSFDYDPRSVEATMSLWRHQGQPAHWRVEAGSVLDRSYLDGLGFFDLVYSWGVLHHTGNLWQALDNACRLVKPGGRLWIASYAKVPRYADDLALKLAYNRASWLRQKYMEYRWIARLMWKRYRRGQSPFAWNHSTTRGMNVYHDLVDWLGGL